MLKSFGFCKNVLIVMALILCSAPAHTEWMLSNNDSTISFTSVKKGSITEVHNFKTLSGRISDSGDTWIGIDLNSVNTLIPIRDERMKKELFETNLYPKASVSAMIDLNTVNTLSVGDRLTLPLTIELNLHGVKKKIQSQLRVVALKNKQLLVSTITPLVVNLEEYKLIAGLSKLQALAKLPSISTTTTITADLVFTQKMNN